MQNDAYRFSSQVKQNVSLKLLKLVVSNHEVDSGIKKNSLVAC